MQYETRKDRSLVSLSTHIRGCCFCRNSPFQVNMWHISCQHHVLCFPWNTHRLEKTGKISKQADFRCSLSSCFMYNRPFCTCVPGCSDWLVKVTSRFSPVRGLSNARRRTGFSLSKANCGRSKVNSSAPVSISSFTCTDGENKTHKKTLKKPNKQAKKYSNTNDSS